MSGIAILSLFKNTRSPSTDFDAQFFVERGGLNSTGLKNIHNTDRIPGTRQHHPIHALDQKAATITGNTEYLVHTLIGLACFIQFSSVKLKTLEIFLSIVIALSALFKGRQLTCRYIGVFLAKQAHINAENPQFDTQLN